MNILSGWEQKSTKSNISVFEPREENALQRAPPLQTRHIAIQERFPPATNSGVAVNVSARNAIPAERRAAGSLNIVGVRRRFRPKASTRLFPCCVRYSHCCNCKLVRVNHSTAQSGTLKLLRLNRGSIS